MPHGTIKKLTDRGFGFIDTGNGDLFFHRSALQNANYEELHEGQSVEYEEGESPKGRCAENVRVAMRCTRCGSDSVFQCKSGNASIIWPLRLFIVRVRCHNCSKLSYRWVMLVGGERVPPSPTSDST